MRKFLLVATKQIGLEVNADNTKYMVMPRYRNAERGHIVKYDNTRWFKYDRDRFVCKQAKLRSSCATLRE